MAYVEAMVALALVLWLNYVRLCLKHRANRSRRDIERRRRQRARINRNFSHRRLVSSAVQSAPAIAFRSVILLRSCYVCCFVRTLNCRFPTGLAPYAILSRDQLAKPDRRGECALKPPPQVVSLKRIGMRIDANAHRSVNARIRIECASNAHYR